MDLDYEFYEQLLNLFLINYNRTNDTKGNFFENIKDETKSTNDKMELFYKYLIDYKKTKPKILPYNKNIKLVEETKYILLIDKEKKYYSINLLSLLIYLINNSIDNSIDKLKWEIIVE